MGRNVSSDIGLVVCVCECQARLRLSISMWKSVPLKLMRFDFDVGVLLDGGDVARMPVRGREWKVAYYCKYSRGNVFHIREWVSVVVVMVSMCVGDVV